MGNCAVLKVHDYRLYMKLSQAKLSEQCQIIRFSHSAATFQKQKQIKTFWKHYLEGNNLLTQI